MRISWLTAMGLLFLVGTIISLTLEGQYLDTGDTSIFWNIVHPTFTNYTNPLLAIGGFFIWMLDWARALWKMLWWDYSFFTGSYEVFRYVGLAVSVGFVVSIVLAIRGTGSS